jgi:hypothetical protein
MTKLNVDVQADIEALDAMVLEDTFASVLVYGNTADEMKERAAAPYDERLGSVWERFFRAAYTAVKPVYARWGEIKDAHLVAEKLYSDAILESIVELGRKGISIKLTSGGRPGSTSLKTYDNDMLRVLRNDKKGTAFALNGEGDFVHGSKNKIAALGKTLATANEKAATEEAFAAAGNIIDIKGASEQKKEEAKGVDTNAPVSVTVNVPAVQESMLDLLPPAIRGEVEAVIDLLVTMTERTRKTAKGDILDGTAAALSHIEGVRKALQNELSGRFKRVVTDAIKSTVAAA